MRLGRVIFLFLAAFTALHATIVSEVGPLPDGASYAALRPAAWNQRRLLLIAPAQRAEASPAAAKLDPTSPLVRSLLAEGWAVATLGYRRPGIVLKDSVDDLRRLRATLADRHGPADRVYVLGESMGGAVAVRLVENHPDDYAGALAVGGAFDLQEPSPTLGVTFLPQRPLLLLPNQSESYAPELYVRAATTAPVTPILWRIGRDGRSNINPAEKHAALQALVRWVESGTVPPANFDAIAPPPEQPSLATFSADNSTATARVRSIDPVRGDLVLEFQPRDLDRVGIARGTWFALVLGDGRVIRTLYGQNLRDTQRLAWMALPEAEGWMIFFAHRGQAAAISGLRVGDSVSIRRLADD